MPDPPDTERLCFIARLIRQKQNEGKACVLGLTTDSSLATVYNGLVRLHKEEGRSFTNVESFNLDEYYPMEPGSLQNYVSVMHEDLFNQIDRPKENIHIPDDTPLIKK